jgi:hypothetical protein
MLANVKFHTGNKNAAAVIPETAVIRSGHLTTAVQFLGDGKFKPVKVQLGNYADGLYQVLSGLKPGDKVVTSAQFLIDSESSLKTAMKNFREPKTNKSSNMNMATDSVQSPLIRKGTIDLKSIDKNNDGMVYQDLMDWNVISDEPGKCPICEMKLSKVSIKEAAKNLIEHGFKINELMDGNSKINDKQMNHENHEHTKIENEYGIESPLIRTGKINLEAIDKNGDGKLWECPMDWNIIGDEYQRCPVCEMKMKEYLIDDVKANLDKHGYEYK